MRALANRFQSPDQVDLFKQRLKSYRQKSGEELLQLADEIERLVRRAYPGVKGRWAEELCRENFVQAVRDERIRQWIVQKRVEGFRAAVSEAAFAEAYYKNREERESKKSGGGGTRLGCNAVSTPGGGGLERCKGSRVPWRSYC